MRSRPVFAWTIPLLLILCSRTALAALPAACYPGDPGEPARVASVIDGDTVILSDSTHVRLIGIDTPEIGHRGAPSEAGALEARAFLASLLRNHESVELLQDAEAHDRYGRRLAHLRLDDGTIAEVPLLQEGLATPLIIPPNLLLVDCYDAAAGGAEAAGRGLWAHPDHEPVSAETLDPAARGYRVVTGAVSSVGQSRSSFWLEMAPHFALRIAREDLRYFHGMELADLAWQAIRARGRLYTAHGQLRMRIRHPLDLNVLEPTRATIPSSGSLKEP